MAKSNQIKFVVITPERQVLEETTDSVIFSAHDGEIGILHDRAPLMCELGIGQLRYHAGSQTRRLFIDGGFAQVNENTVTILTPHALLAEDITAETVAEAERSVEELRGTDPETLEARTKAQRRLSVLRGLQ